MDSVVRLLAALSAVPTRSPTTCKKEIILILILKIILILKLILTLILILILILILTRCAFQCVTGVLPFYLTNCSA